jgi:TRAP-type mannitol/chloroaromatic compound transport system permease small subunit
LALDRDTSSDGPEHGNGIIHTVLRGIVWISGAAAWLIVPILVLVFLGVSLSMAKVGTIFQWEDDIFLFGSKLTLASLGDIQWHLFGIMLMFTMAGAIVSDKHVRVDFLRQHMRDRTKTIVDVLGHLFFLLPLCAIVTYHGYDFALRSFVMGEGSNYDGLYDRFVIKAFIPIGFFLMLLAGVGLALLGFRKLVSAGRGQSDD